MNGGIAQAVRAAASADPQMTRQAQLIALRLAAPKRADAGKIIAVQDDASDCPLFIAANEPRLF